MSTPRLFHYTCSHAAKSIRSLGLVKPNYAFELAPFAWFTDLEEPDTDRLGLSAKVLECDRTEYEFEAVSPAMLQRYGTIRHHLVPWFRDAIELAPGAEPAHWWVGLASIEVVEVAR